MYEIFEKLCQIKGITAYRFCKDTGINASTISTWKKNNSLAGPDLAKKVCDYFDILLDYLMGNSFIEEMGCFIQEERMKKKISQEELAVEAGITIDDLELFESDVKSIREDIFDTIVSALGTTHYELMDKYGLYDEYVPPYFDGDITKHEATKRARDKDAMMEKISPFVARDNTERRLLMVCRKAGNVSDEEKDAIINQFEATMDMYLKAKGIKGE